MKRRGRRRGGGGGGGGGKRGGEKRREKKTQKGGGGGVAGGGGGGGGGGDAAGWDSLTEVRSMKQGWATVSASVLHTGVSEISSGGAYTFWTSTSLPLPLHLPQASSLPESQQSAFLSSTAFCTHTQHAITVAVSVPALQEDRPCRRAQRQRHNGLVTVTCQRCFGHHSMGFFMPQEHLLQLCADVRK